MNKDITWDVSKVLRWILNMSGIRTMSSHYSEDEFCGCCGSKRDGFLNHCWKCGACFFVRSAAIIASRKAVKGWRSMSAEAKSHLSAMPRLAPDLNIEQYPEDEESDSDSDGADERQQMGVSSL